MYFGSTGYRINLLGQNGEFPSGSVLTWDFNIHPVWMFLESIPTDCWDELFLVTDSNDGIRINRIKIVHSKVAILDWDNANVWLDGSKGEAYGILGLVAKILEYKLSKIDNMWQPQLHWAACELGKSDGDKYYDEPDGKWWCSEFTSWCLHKALWNPPGGSINMNHMINYFEGINRCFSYEDVLDGNYVLHPGNYLSFEWGHSGLFVKYLSDPDNPSESTEIRTIEGNAGGTVKIRKRTIRWDDEDDDGNEFETGVFKIGSTK